MNQQVQYVLTIVHPVMVCFDQPSYMVSMSKGTKIAVATLLLSSNCMRHNYL